MNEVKIFENAQFGQIRTAGTSEEPLFCLADICKVLELQPSRVKSRLNPRGVTSSKVGVQTGVKGDGTPAIQDVEMLFVNEQNLYKVIMRSDKPQAESFQDWVCGEVLPSIRKSGGYMTAAPEETPEQIMAKALRIADETMKRQMLELEAAKVQIQSKDETIEAQENEIKRLAPAADYTHQVLQSTSTFTLTELAKDMGFRSVHELTKWAVAHGILYRQSDRWLPTAKYSGKGYFSTRTCKYVKSDNSIGTSLSTVVTERGRAFLHLFLSDCQKKQQQANTTEQ